MPFGRHVLFQRLNAVYTPLLPKTYITEHIFQDDEADTSQATTESVVDRFFTVA